MNDLFSVNLKSSYIINGILAPVSNSIIISNPLQIINYSSPQESDTHEYLTNDDVTAISISFDSRFIAYSTEVIRIYDIESKKVKRTLSGHNYPVTSIAPNHKSPYIWASSSSEDGMVNVWDIRSHPACVFSKKVSKIINCVSFSPDDSLLACGGDQLIILDTINFHVILLFPNNLPSLINSLYFNPSEYVILTSSGDKVLRCYDIETMECISQSIPFQSPIRGVQFDLNGEYVFAVTDKSLTLMTFEPYEVINVISLINNINGDYCMQQTLDFIINPLDTNQIMILIWDEKKNVTIKCSSILNLFNNTSNQNDELVISINGKDDDSNNCISPDEESLNSIPSLPSPPTINNDIMKESLSMNDLDIPPINKIQTLRKVSPSPVQVRRTPTKQSQRKLSPDIIIKTKSPSVKPRAPSVPKSSLNISDSTNKLNKTITKDCRSKSISSLKRDSFSPAISSPSIPSKVSPKSSTTTPIKKVINRSSSSNISNNKNNDILNKSKSRPPIDTPQTTPTKTQQSLISKFQTIQAKCEADNKVMLRELDTMITLIKDGGLKKVLSQRMAFSKASSMSIVIRELLNMDSIWSLQTCELVIPHLNNLLSSRNSDNINIGLETLKLIVTEYVPIILENMKTPDEYNYRGDVVGAERKERSITCHQRLLQLFLNGSFLKERMNKEQQSYFQEIVDNSGLDIK